MLCSRCSEKVRPIVAIDIDGTLADYHGHFLNFASNWLNIALGEDDWNDYDGSVPFREWFCEAYATDVTTFRAIKLAYRQGGMKRTQPVHHGAAALVNSIRQQAEVWLTTTRPHDRYDRVDPDTREWLKRHGIEYDALLFNDDKMEELADRVDRNRVVAVLDDDLDILETARAYRLGVPILARGEYNGAVIWDSTAEGLINAYNQINALVEGWTRKHG